jgi:hypothetical protein
MKKLIAVPVVAVIAAAGAASAAGFAGGVSAGPIQTGQTNDLTCATSAKVIEWGLNDHTAVPYVDTVRVQLNGAHCEGQALHVVTLKPNGTQDHRATSAKIATGQGGNTQYARLSFPANDQPTVSDLNSVRISVDPGFSGMTEAPVG